MFTKYIARISSMKSSNEESSIFDKAKELLKSNISEQTRIGMKNIIYLFIEKYAPVIELFDFICDERDSPKLHKNIDTLERIF